MLNDSLSNSASFSYRKRGGDRRGGMSGTTRDDLANSAKSEAYLAFMPRRWKKGEVYSPRDLKAEEQNRWRYSKGRNLPPIQNAERRKKVPDAVDTLGFNPLDNYRVRVFLIFITPPTIPNPIFHTFPHTYMLIKR